MVSPRLMPPSSPDPSPPAALSAERALALHEEAAADRRRAEAARQEAAELRAKLAKTTAALAGADAELADALRERADAWRELTAANDALSGLRTHAGSLATERAGLRKEIRALRVEAERLRTEHGLAASSLRAAQADLEADRGRVRAMRDSLSWKMTLPLRVVGRALPALAGRAGGQMANGDAGPGGDTGALAVGRGADFQFGLDLPKDWNLDDRRARIAGWCVAPGGRGLLTAARVVCRGVVTEGRYGFPRPDVATNLGLDGGRENCGFDIDVDLPAGPCWVNLEMRDADGQWHRVGEFQARTPTGAFWALKRRVTGPTVAENATSLGLDTPSDWNLLSKHLRIAGWCLPPAGGRITAIRAVCGKTVALGQHGYRRPDVAELFSLQPGTEKCGFEIFIDLPGGRHTLHIEVCDEHGRWHVVGRFPFKAPLLARIAAKTEADSISDYATWVGTHDTFSPSLRRWVRARSEALSFKPLISVVMPTYNTPERYLLRAIESVRDQVYDHWEFCIADDASTQPHVRAILERFAAKDKRFKLTFRERNGHISAASNSALLTATGQYVALLDHDDELAPGALYAVADEINAHPDAELLYSDEDKIDAQGRRFGPYFKPDWNPDLLTGQNYLCHLLVYKAELIRSLGGFRVGLEGSQDWDLILRATDALDPAKIRHIPRILYHWRAIATSTALITEAKSYIMTSGERALRDHFARRGENVTLLETAEGYWRAKYRLPDPPPLVSIVIPTRNQVAVNNGSDDPETLDYLSRLPRIDPRCRAVDYDRPFNYSAINNWAVREHARGDLVLLLNNDMEVITRGWLEELAAQAARPEIGCVGAMLYYPDDTIQHAGVVLGTGGVAGHAFKYFPRGEGGHNSRARLPQNYSAVTAACLMIRRGTFLAVGGLDEENLTVAFNDIDFCLKVRATGLRNLWTPFAELYHHESASRGLETTPEKVERFGQEIETMRARWEAILQNDPAYNPNLTLKREDFSFASPPRLAKTWGDLAV